MAITSIRPMSYVAFTKLSTGTRIDNYGYAQCVAVANQYHEGVLGKPLPIGFSSAYQWWTEYGSQPNLKAVYTRSQTPKAGALFVARGGRYDAVDGHIGLVTAVHADGTFSTLEQNAEKNRYLARYRRTKEPSVYGFLIPKTNPAVKPAAPDPQRRRHNMLLAHYKDAGGPGQERWAFFGPGFWLELETKAAVVRFKQQLRMDVDSFECGGRAPWEKFKAAARPDLVPQPPTILAP